MFDPRVDLPADHRGDNHLWYVVRRGEILVTADGIPIGSEAPAVEAIGHQLIGLLRGDAVFALEVAPDSDPPPDHEFIHLRKLYGQIPEEQWVLGGRAEQLATFDRTHKFCGQCGEATHAPPNERARKCERCGHVAFPRLTPAVIMLVERGDEILLAHGRQFPGRFFSALAGFVEPGETLEQAVAREVAEEVGLDIDDITYFGSQPWPFPHSLMIGFTASYVGGEISIQEEEIVEAGWYRTDDLPPCPIGGMSIAGALIQSFIDRVASGAVRPEAARTDDEPKKRTSIWERSTN